MQVAVSKTDQQQTVTSEVILLSVDPKVGSVDLPAYCAIADHAFTKSLTVSSQQQQPNLSHSQQQRAGNSHIPSQKYHAGAAKAKDLVRVAQQTDILLFVMLKQLSAVSLCPAETSYMYTDTTAEALHSTRPVTTLSFLSKWAQRAAADGTVAMVLGELQRAIGGGDGARSPRGGNVGYGFQSQGPRHITIAAPCLSPSMLPHLLARQQAVIEEHEGFASPQLGLPPVVACIELSHSKEWAEQPHLPLDASQQTRSPNLLLGPLPAAVALPTGGKKGAGSGSGGVVGGANVGTAGGANSGTGGSAAASAGGIGAGTTQAVACGNAIDTDGTAKLSLPHDPSLLEHMRIQLIRPFCSSSGASAVSLLANHPGGALLQGAGAANGLSSGTTKSAAAAAAAGGPSNLKKGGGGGASAAKTSSSLGGAGGASAALAGGAGGLSGLVRAPPLPSSFSCNTVASDHPIPRPVGLAIAMKLREFLTTIHELCVRYFSNSIVNPIILDGVAMGSVSGLSYFDNCVSALRRAERMRHLAAALSAVAAVNTAAGGNSSAPPASAVPTSKSGSRSAAAAAASASVITPESDFLALRPEDRGAMVEKDVVEALLTEASKAVMLDNGLSPLQAIAAAASIASSSSLGGGASAGGVSQTGTSSAQTSSTGRGQGGAGASRGQSGAVGGTSSSSSAAAAAASSTQNAKNIVMSTTSAAGLYVALSAFVRSPHTTMVDVRVASLLVAVSAQLVVLRGVINAYGAPIPVTSSAPPSAAVPVPAQTSGKQQSSSAAASSAASSVSKPQLAYVRITPADFSTTVEAHHVRAFFTTPPPIQLAPPPVVAEKGSGGAKGMAAPSSSSTANTPLLVQQVPLAAMAALPSALLDIVGNLCGVEEAMRGELLSSDGIVDLSTMARTEHFMPSTADKILQHLSADLANAKSSLFKPKCPAVEVPLLWVPPTPPPSSVSSLSPTQEITTPPVATPASGTRPLARHSNTNKESSSSPSSTAALLSATNAAATTSAELVSPTVSAGGIVLPPINFSVFQLGTALHHDGCSVFKLHINPFPSAVVTSAVVCEGIRLAATEMEKVRSHARFSPSAASTRSAMGSGALDPMRCYTTLFETPAGAGAGGGASSSMGMREVARLIAAPAESVDGLLTAVTDGVSAPSHQHNGKGRRSGYGAGEDIEVLEVVDVEKHNLRLLNRALAETRVRLAAVEKGKRLVERQRAGLGANLHAGDNAALGGPDGGGADPHNATQQTSSGAKSTTSPQRGAGGGNSGTSRGNVAPGVKKGRTTSLAPQQANAGAEGGGVLQTNDPTSGPSSDTTLSNNNAAGFSMESIADEKRGNDVLRRSDPIPRKLVPTAGGGVQSSFLYVQPRPDVVAQNRAEEEAVRAILAPTTAHRASGKELAKRFVGSFFNKTFGGGVSDNSGKGKAFSITSAGEQRSGTVPTVNSNPCGLVDDLVSTRVCGDNAAAESEDSLASQRLSAERVMLLREVSKAARIIGSSKQQTAVGSSGAIDIIDDDGDFSSRRGESYLAQLCRSSIAEREGLRALLSHTAPKQRVEKPLLFTGGDETGGLALLSHAASSSATKNTNNFFPALGAAQRRLSVERSDAVRGVNSTLDGRAPPIGNSAHVTSWINKTLSPNEQQFLLGQAVLFELAKANFPCLTPRFTTSCHYFTEDATTTAIRSTSGGGAGRSGSVFPAAVAERAGPLFALFPNNVRVAVVGKTFTDALSSPTTSTDEHNNVGAAGSVSADTLGRKRGGEQTSTTSWSPPATCGYLAIGITHFSNASATTVQQPDSDSYGEIPLALESNERKRVSRWSFSAVVGDRAHFCVDPSSLSAALSHFAGKANPQEKPTTISGGAAKEGVRLLAGSAVVGVRPQSGPTPLPMLRDADDESDLLIGDRTENNSFTGGGRGIQKQSPQLLPPTTTAPPFFSSSSALTSGAAVSTHGALVGVGGRRVVRGERTMVLPYDGSIVEVTATLGGARGGSSGNTGIIKYHRSDVTVAGHYTIGKNGYVTPQISSESSPSSLSPPHRIVVSFPDEALLLSSSSGASGGSENGAGSAALGGSLAGKSLSASAPRTPLVTVEGNLMTITDRQSDERLACVTRVKGIVRDGGEKSSSPYGSNPKITFASLSTSLHTAAIGGPLLSDVSGSQVAACVALHTVTSGVTKKRKNQTPRGPIKTSLIDLPPRALVSLAAIIATKRAPLASIARQLQAVSTAAASDLQSAANSAIAASIIANASATLTSSSASKKGGGGGAGGGAKSTSSSQAASGGGGSSSARSNTPAANNSLSVTGSQQQQQQQQIMLASLSSSHLPPNGSASSTNRGAIAPASIPETVVERALLSAASSAAACVAEAACTAIAQKAGATILNKLRSSSEFVGTAGGAVPPLPHYQTRSLALNSGIVASTSDDVDLNRSHNRPAPIPIVGYSAWFRRGDSVSDATDICNNNSSDEEGGDDNHDDDVEEGGTAQKRSPKTVFSSLRTGIRVQSDIEQSRDVCSVSGVVTVRYVSGSITKLFPDGSVATLLVCPSDKAVGYYTGLTARTSGSSRGGEGENRAFVFSPCPLHPTLQPEGWSLAHPHTAHSSRKGQGITSSRLGVGVSAALTASSLALGSGGSAETSGPKGAAGVGARPPSPTTRGTANKVHPTTNASNASGASGTRKQGGSVAADLSVANVFVRPPSATFLKAAAASASISPSGLGSGGVHDPSVAYDTSILGPIPIAVPKYWLLTSPTGKRCARRCGGSVLDASSSAFPKTEEWCSMRFNCESLLPAIVTEDGAFLSPSPSSPSSASSLSSFVKPLRPLPAAVAYDAQNLCHVVSRADGTIIASYNQHAERPTFIPTSPQRTAATGTKASPAPHKQSSPPTQLRDADGSGKACIRVSIHADGTTIVGVLAPSSCASSSSKPMLPNFVPIPTHLSALDGLIHFLAGHAIEKCGGDVTAVWPESLGLSFRSSNDGGAPSGLSTSLVFLVEHPRFPRVILRRNSPITTSTGTPHDTFVLYSDQTLLASELVTVRVPATQHTKPGGGAGGHFESGVGVSGGGHGKHPHPSPFFHTRLVRPNGTTVRVMNTNPFSAQTPQSEATIGTAPVLIIEPSHVAMSLQSPYRQLLCPTATFGFQATTSILGNIPTSLSGKARHMATVATSAALHEACPVFSLSISDRSDSASVDGTPLMRLVDSRNYVTSVWSRALVVGFDRNTTERLLVNMAPQGLATHAMSKRRQAEEAMKRSSGKAALSSSPTVLSGADNFNFMSPLELSLRAVARSFITKYALIGTPQVGIFHRAREDTLRPQINRTNNNNPSDPDGASTTAPSVFSRASENASVFGGAANVGGGGGGGMDATLGGLIPSRFTPGRENPALLSEKETSESLYSLGLDYNPHLYVVKEAKGEHKESNVSKQLIFTQLLSVRDLAPYIRYNIARSNPSGPIATDLTTTNNEEDDLAERCLAIFPASASGPVFSSVITASKSIASGEPHVEQLHFYESYRVPNLLPATASGVEGANTASNSIREVPQQYVDPMMTSLSSMLRARAGGMASSPSSFAIAAPPLHRPHQGICAWLPKTALPPKRLLMPHHQTSSSSSSSAGMTAGQQMGGAAINWLGQGHSQHVTSNARQLLRFQRYNVPIRDAVAAVHLSVEEQRRSMVIYTRGVVAQTEREEQRNRDCGVGDLQERYKTQLEAIKRGVDPSQITLANSLGSRADNDNVVEGQSMHGGGDVMVLTLEGSPPDSPRTAAGSDDPTTDIAAAEHDGVAAGGGATGASIDTNQQRRDLIKSTNTARERAVVYLNQRMVKPLCSSIIVCDPYPTLAFGLLPVPVFDDRPLRPDGTAPPPEPLYPFKYQMKGTIRNITNDTVLLVIRNPTKKVDDRTGERRLVSAISVVEGNNMRLGPNGSATFCIELETTTNEMVRRSIGDAVGQIAKQEEARLAAIARAEAEGSSPPGARRFVMDLVERLRIDVVGACEPLVLNVTASFVLNTSLKGATIPKPGVFIKT